MTILDLLLIAGAGFAVIFFIYLPAQRKTREHQNLVDSLVEGDEVILNSGIHGFVASVEDNIIWLEVSDGVEFKVSKSAVQSKIEAD